MAEMGHTDTGRDARAYPPEDGYDRTTSDGGASIAGLIQQIVGDVQGIIRSEVQLAKTEVKEDVTATGKAAGVVAAGALLALYALGFLLLGAVYALRGSLPDWAAALIVAIVVAIAAGVMIMLGLDRLKSVNPAPDKTIDSIKEDVKWVKRQTS